MKENLKPIGVLDSGVGGFSAVAQIKKLLPGEDIVYFGDSANCPYGSKTRDEVMTLSQKAVNFLRSKNVKAIILACNTVSTQLMTIESGDIPTVGIIEPICQGFPEHIRKVGIVGTPLTVKSGIYDSLFKKYNSNLEITSVYSDRLAYIIEKGDISSPVLREEFKKAADAALSNGAKDIILGCTHYPLALDCFKEMYPDVTFHDPAYYEILRLTDILKLKNILNDENNKGSFSFYASGGMDSAEKLIKKLDIKNIKEISSHVSMYI